MRPTVKSPFRRGLGDGVPILLGYLSVSFGFGITAVRLGIPWWGATLISLTNLTSAGQAAGVEIMAAGGTLLELGLAQLIINLRYALMGVSLSQNLAPSFTMPKRILLAFGITDEVYALAITRVEPITARYMAGLIIGPIAGWTTGTLLGGVAGQLLPTRISDAMGILLYGMFLAIIIPPAKKSRGILTAILAGGAVRTLFYYLLPGFSGGFAVIIAALVGSAAAALLFPQREVGA